MIRCRLLNAADESVLDVENICCDWGFTRESLDLLRNMDDRRLVDALLNLRRVFPNCTATLDLASEWMRKHLGLGFRVIVELENGGAYCERRTVCLDDGNAPMLDNSL